MENELRQAELLHQNNIKEAKSENDIKLEDLRYKRQLENIAFKNRENNKSRELRRETTQKHIEYAKQDDRERGHCR